MRYLGTDSLCNASWYAFSDESVITTPWYLPRLCDPVLVMPSESPDGAWHLFAHTWIGVQHYLSTSGLMWKPQHLIQLRGHSPYIYHIGTMYYLLYEIHSKNYGHKMQKGEISRSRIMMCSSTDLLLWSEPKLILDSKDVPFATSYGPNPRISRPQLVAWEGHYRLYFGASRVNLYDSEQKAEAYLGMAESDSLDIPFVPLSRPVLSVDPDSTNRNLAVGSVKIVPCSDGLAAIECAFSYDEKARRSVSKLLLLTSTDGISWKERRTIMSSPAKGWASRYLTSADVAYKEDEKTWYCYFSANEKRNAIPILGVREGLGLLLGRTR